MYIFVSIAGNPVFVLRPISEETVSGISDVSDAWEVNLVVRVLASVLIGRFARGHW